MHKLFTTYFKILIVLTGLALGFYSSGVQAQCLICPQNDFSINPNSSWQLQSSSIETGGCKIFKVQVVEGYTYTFKTGCEDGADANFDTYIELSDSNCIYITYNDDDCDLLSKIEWVSPYSGVAYLKVRGYNDNFGDFTLAYKSCSANSQFTYVTNGFTVDFTNLSTDTTSSYQWYFGDGFNGNTMNPSHTYVCPFDIQVSLVVTDSGGCSTNATQSLSFNNALEGNYSYSNTNNEYSFTDLSSGDPISWEWDFGDGSSSTDQNPTHSYVCAGYFDVALTVTNADGCTNTYLDYVYVSESSSNLSANFNYASQGVITGFHDISSGNPTTWEWDFGDGTTSTIQNPTHTYQCSGSYWVSLYVTNANGCESSNYLLVEAPGQYTLEAQYSVDIQGSVVNFTDASVGTPTSYEWDLDAAIVTTQNASIDYHCSGMYYVSLTVANDFCTSTQYSTVEVEGTSQADFTYSVQSNTVTFTNASTGANLTYDWDFDDASNSTEASPVHPYSCPGDYNVTLSVYDDFGCSDYSTQTINLGGFTASFEYAINNSSVNFTNTSASTDTWSWEFGDGTTSTGQNPNHVYSCPDFYTVSLTVTNSHGCSATYSEQIEITAGFQAGYSYVVNGTTVTFTNTSGANTSNWDWYFGDGNSSSLENPSHTFTCPGQYYVSINVDNATGCSGYYEELIQVGGLNPAFTYTLNNQTANFQVSNTAGISSYEWDFDDGGFSTIAAPTHTFANCGQYYVYCTVNDANGCSNYHYERIIIQGSNSNLNLTSNSPVCQGNDILISSGNASGMEYYWNGPNFYYSYNPNPVLENATTDLSGTYYFELTDVNGCPVIDSLNIEVVGDVFVNVTVASNTLTANASSSYQWMNCASNSPVNGANGQVFTPTENGSYYVVITDANGCQGESECFLISGIGFDEVNGSNLQLYPNPTTGKVNIKGLSANSKLKLSDAVGRVYSVSVENQTIDLSALSSGVYFLSVENANGLNSFKVVKN